MATIKSTILTAILLLSVSSMAGTPQVSQHIYRAMAYSTMNNCAKQLPLLSDDLSRGYYSVLSDAYLIKDIFLEDESAIVRLEFGSEFNTIYVSVKFTLRSSAIIFKRILNGKSDHLFVFNAFDWIEASDTDSTDSYTIRGSSMLVWNEGANKFSSLEGLLFPERMSSWKQALGL